MSAPAVSAVLVNPFPGLRPFKEGEEYLYFGREKQTDALIDKLGQTRFLAVIGSSGSGKSSLVNCGLLPALRGGHMAAVGTHWRIVQCRPSGQPIRSLAAALAEPDALYDKFNGGTLQLSDIVDSNLHMSERGIVDVFELARQNSDVNLLIVVDQFEELFRYTAAEINSPQQIDKARSEAAEFIKLLLHAQKQTDKPIYVVLTMRSDFLGDCTQFEGLAEAINEGQYLVPRMSREERRLAISGPVAVGGAQIDPVLLTRLVNDLGDDPDQLSILQHALNRIWARWSGLGEHEDALSLAHYSSIGSMKLALDQHAEQVFETLTSERQQLICEKLFKALTNKATDGRGVRRPTKMSVLCDLTGTTIEELTDVIDVFRKPSRSFLMPSSTKALEPDTVIDISHESLMRMWKRLIIWANEEAESSNIYRRLSSTAALHAKGQAGLWRDPDLQLALEWRMRAEPNEYWASRISPGFEQAMIFLDQSREVSDTEAATALHAAEQEKDLKHSKYIAREQQKLLETQAIASRKQLQVIWLISAVLVLSSVLLGFFKIEQDKTNLQVGNQAATVETLKNIILFLNVEESLAKDSKQQIVEIQSTQNSNEQLLLQSQISEPQQAVLRTFENRSDKQLQLFALDKNGLYSNPVVLEPGAQEEIKGATNEIWVARVIPSFSIYTTGVFK